MRPRAAAWQTIRYLLGNNLPNNWSKIWRNAIFKFCVTTVMVLQWENKQTPPLVLVLADFIIRSLPPPPPLLRNHVTLLLSQSSSGLSIRTLVVFPPIHVLSCYFYVSPLNSVAVPPVWIVIIGRLSSEQAEVDFFCTLEPWFWANVWANLLCKAPCKRTQHCWPTTPNIVGCYMLRPFAHPVACCCVLLRKVWNRSNFSANNS